MAVNKVIYDGQTLIDLTGDTITADNVLSAFTFHDKSGAEATGTCTFDADTKDADATAAEILATKTAYVNGQKVIGSMANNGAVTGEITTKDGDYTVPVGFHDGAGKVGIAAGEKAKLIAENIKEGIDILGITGTFTGVPDKTQTKTVKPTTSEQQITPDEGFDYLASVTVQAIPYATAENPQGGTTVTIG